MDIAKAEVANALTSATSNHVIAVAHDIYDEKEGKYQEDINKEAKSGIEANKGAVEVLGRELRDAKGGVEEVKKLASTINDNINANIKEYLGALQQMATGFSFKTTEGEVFFNWEDLPEKKK